MMRFRIVYIPAAGIIMEQQNRGRTSWNVNHFYVINMSSQINSFFCSSCPSSKMLSAKIKTYALDTTPRLSLQVKTSFSGISVQINYVLTNRPERSSKDCHLFSQTNL